MFMGLSSTFPRCLKSNFYPLRKIYAVTEKPAPCSRNLCIYHWTAGLVAMPRRVLLHKDMLNCSACLGGSWWKPLEEAPGGWHGSILLAEVGTAEAHSQLLRCYICCAVLLWSMGDSCPCSLVTAGLTCPDRDSTSSVHARDGFFPLLWQVLKSFKEFSHPSPEGKEIFVSSC